VDPNDLALFGLGGQLDQVVANLRGLLRRQVGVTSCGVGVLDQPAPLNLSDE
jgi:hypothetical protein